MNKKITEREFAKKIRNLTDQELASLREILNIEMALRIKLQRDEDKSRKQEKMTASEGRYYGRPWIC